MSRRWMLRVGLSCLLAGVPGVLPADTVELKSGLTIEGEIIRFDGKAMTVRQRFGEGSAEVLYPLNLVVRVVLVPSPVLEAALESPGVSAIPVLEKAWKFRERFLPVRETDAGRVGLALARALLATQKKKDAQAALGVIERVRARDWNETRKEEAGRLRLTALAASGKVEEALDEAAQLERLAGEDEAALVRVRARAVLLKADQAWKKLLKVEDEWPKWREMPGPSASHARLREEALDGYVHPSVFHPELADAASEGLWKAVEAHRHLGQTGAAAVLAREICDYYPASAVTSRAEQFLKQHPQPKNKNP